MTNKNDFRMEIKSSVLKDVITALRVVHDESLWHVTAEGISTKMVDPSHVMMVDLSMSRHACEEYIGGEKDIAIPLEKLHQVLLLSSKDERVVLENMNGQQKLHVRFGPIHRKIPLLDQKGIISPDTFPSVEWKVKAAGAAEHLMMGLKATEQVSTEAFSIHAAAGELNMMAENDNDEVTITFKNGESGELSVLDVSEESKSSYSHEFMGPALRAAHHDAVVSLEFTSDHPILVCYGFADETVAVKYMLAPRIESE